MTSPAALQTAISKLTVWRKGDQRAPHKPLLLLYVLSEYKKGHEQLFNYGDEIHQPLLQLLTDFGPSRKKHYPSMPFWRLRGDGFWELENAEHCTPRPRSKEPPKQELIEHQVAGGFDSTSFQLLLRRPALIDKLAQQILNEHFPESVQVSLAERLGFDINKGLNSRDPRFRDVVLRAYHYRCAVCGYDLRLGWLTGRSGSRPHQMETVRWPLPCGEWFGTLHTSSFRF